MPSAIFVIFMMIFSIHAAAAELVPKIDVDQVCRNNLSERKKPREGSYEKQYSNCFEEAQQAYDKVKIKWPDLSDNERKICLREIDTRSVPYSTLLYCVESTMLAKEKARREAEDAAARRQVPRREFRY